MKEWAIENEQTSKTHSVKTPSKYEDYQLYTAYCLFVFFHKIEIQEEEAKKSKQWKKAIENETNLLAMDLSEYTKTIIDTRWVFRTKSDGI